MIKEESRRSLETVCRQKVPGAVMAFLGGSQAVDNAKNKLPGSDYDIVILTQQTPYPYSLNHYRHDLVEQSMDLIVRDAETLAFEMQDARRRGRAAIPKIITQGLVVFDDNDTASQVQDKMQEFLQQGPDPLPAAEDQFLYTEIAQKIKTLQPVDKNLRKLAAYELTHNVATLHLHRKRQWHASGKLLGRFLLQDQAFKQQLEMRFIYSHSTGKPDFMLPLLKKPPATTESMPPSPLLSLAAQEKNDMLRDDFLIRYSSETLRQYLCDKPHNQQQAYDFMAGKLYTLVQALDPGRLGRASNEYFYALCRVVYNFSEFAGIVYQSANTIGTRYNALANAFPEIGVKVQEAQSGKPQKLKAMVEEFSASLSPCYDQPVKTMSPSCFRTQDGALKKLILG